MRKTTLLLAVLAAAAALAAPATAAGRWQTERAVLAQAKASGVYFNDSSHGRPVAGFCHGLGAWHGNTVAPSFQMFRCTLVLRTGAGTAWLDVRLYSLPRGLYAVVLGRY